MVQRLRADRLRREWRFGYLTGRFRQWRAAAAVGNRPDGVEPRRAGHHIRRHARRTAALHELPAHPRQTPARARARLDAWRAFARPAALLRASAEPVLARDGRVVRRGIAAVLPKARCAPSCLRHRRLGRAEALRARRQPGRRDRARVGSTERNRGVARARKDDTRRGVQRRQGERSLQTARVAAARGRGARADRDRGAAVDQPRLRRTRCVAQIRAMAAVARLHRGGVSEAPHGHLAMRKCSGVSPGCWRCTRRTRARRCGRRR